MVDKLIECSSEEEYTENIDQVKIAEMALFEDQIHNLFVILAVIALTISIGIGAYFAYKYMNHS